MKRIVLCVIFLLGCSPDVNNQQIDMQAPGKTLVINYWAIWCAPCRKEIPELNELARDHAESVIVLGVNFDGSQGETLASEIEKLGIEFDNLPSDPRQIWNLEPVSVLPETLIISPDGQLMHRLIGPQTLASMRALL